MGYNRAIVPQSYSSKEVLTSDMVGIGMLFADHGSKNPNIENTLLAASVEGVEGQDYRTLSLLVDWLEIHGDRTNADRLIHLVLNQKSERTRCFWSAVAHWLKKDRRLKKLQSAYSGPRLDLLSAGTAFLIKRDGEDPRFAGSPLRVPAKTIRHRPKDILSPHELAKRHAVYRARLTIGPTYRADMWASVENEPKISTAELARRSYGSFATAWQVKKDWNTLKGRGLKACVRT